MNRNKRQEADGREGRKETESGRREANDWEGEARKERKSQRRTPSETHSHNNYAPAIQLHFPV